MTRGDVKFERVHLERENALSAPVFMVRFVRQESYCGSCKRLKYTESQGKRRAIATIQRRQVLSSWLSVGTELSAPLLAIESSGASVAREIILVTRT